jgi:ABC-type oligopeptide transport system substrate-binding subunit
MIKSRAYKLALALVLALVLSSCGASSADKAETGRETVEYRDYIAAPSGVFDPYAASDSGNGTDALISGLTSGTLVEPDPESPEGTLRYIGALAEGLPIVSEDGLVWTYRIREGLKYSDGSVLDAFSFEEAFKTLLAPERAYPSASQYWTAVKITGARAYATGEPGSSWAGVGVDAPNRLTLRFTLEEAVASPVGLQALNILLPHSGVYETAGYDPVYAPVSGPYKVVGYAPGEMMMLEKNYNYPNSYKYADDLIELRFAENAEPPDDPSVPWFVYMNPQFVDDNLRNALYWGVDRGAALESVSEVMAGIMPVNHLNLTPAASFIPKDAWVGDPLTEDMLRYGDLPLSLGSGYDPALALDYFEQAYIANGSQRINLTITCFGEEEFWGVMAIALRDQWMALFGPDRFHLYLELKQTEETYQAYTIGAYQLGFGALSYNPMDVWAALACWSSGYPNKLDGFYNVDFDRLQYSCALGDLRTDYAAKSAALATLDELLLGYMPAIPLFYN